MKKSALLLIDGFNLLSRGYFATSYNRTEEQLSKTKDGLYTNGIRVFLQKLFNLIDEHHITHVAIAWDVKREELGRRKKYDFYKATRNELPAPLIQQHGTLTKKLEQMGIPQFVLPPYEADDIIGTLSTKWSNETENACFIYSNDKDLHQLLNSQTAQIIARKRQEIIYTNEQFYNEFQIHPTQWVDVKALLGDPSDNIPGCPGVGEKSALPLIQQYTSVEKLYEEIESLDKKFNRYKKKLIEGRESVFMSKELATICCHIEDSSPLSFHELELEIDGDNVCKTLEELELTLKLPTFITE